MVDDWFGKDSLLRLILSSSLGRRRVKGLEGGRAGLEVRRKGMNKEEDRGWNGRVEKEEVGWGWKLVGVGPGGVG